MPCIRALDESRIATRHPLEIVVWTNEEGVAYGNRLCGSRAVAESADALGLTSATMPSGAGHDAQSMARLVPMGMIFVPSVGGISHSPKELTTWEDCARGADVLLRSVLAADARAWPT